MMKRIIPLVAVTLLLLSACSEQTDLTTPVTGDTSNETLLKMIEDFDISNEQMAQLDEMYYLDEDLDQLLNAGQMHTLNGILGSPDPGDGRVMRPGPGLDFGAIMYLRLILKANPDMDEAKKLALIELIKNYNEARRQAIEDNMGDPDAIREALKALHDELMEKMKELLTLEELQNVEDLIEEIKERREERREEWKERRLNYQMATWTRILHLDEGQAVDVRSALEQLYADIAALRTQEPPLTPEEFRAAIQELKEAFDAWMLGEDLGLSEEQKEIWEKMKTAKRRIDPRRGMRG